MKRASQCYEMTVETINLMHEKNVKKSMVNLLHVLDEVFVISSPVDAKVLVKKEKNQK